MWQVFDNIQLVCWSITYVLIIYKGFKEHTYGMPFLALAFNISWELNRFNASILSFQSFMLFVWLVLDIVILITFFKYAFNYISSPPPEKIIYSKEFLYFAAVVLLLIFMIGMRILFKYFSQYVAVAAFTDNTVMSLLFIRMLVTRKCTRGQSVFIGVFKMIGTFAAGLAVYFESADVVCLVMGCICAVIDIIYIVMLAVYKKKTTFEIKKYRGIKF